MKVFRTFGDSFSGLRRLLMILAFLLMIGSHKAAEPAITESPAEAAVILDSQNKTETETGDVDLKHLEGADEEMLLFTDIPIVISASRQSQPINLSSVPVSIITSEDIHAGGLTQIPEILQFVPGMDYVQLDRNRYAIGVRGFHDMFTNRTLTLVDGRLADHAMFGGAEWFSDTTLVEDIDRIEVVRGPGGAAWGPNAFTGVINIITKEPEDCPGWFGSSTVSHFGDSYSHIRWAEKSGPWSWRTSIGYTDRRDSDDAGNGAVAPKNASVDNQLHYSQLPPRDYIQNWRVDNKVNYRFSDQVNLQTGMAWSHAQFGAFEFGGYYPQTDGWQNTARFFSKLNFTGDHEDSGYLQWYGNFIDSRNPSLLSYCTSDNNLDGQYNFKLGDAHQVSTGGNFRWMYINTKHEKPYEMNINGEPLNEYMVGAFIIDRWTLTDRLTLESQLRGDWYSETQVDWAGRFGALYALDEKKDHILRLAWAKAFRTPYSSLQQLTTSRCHFVTGHPAPYDSFDYFNLLLPAEDLKNEETWSVEAGYTGQLAKGVTLRVDGYGQRFERLISYRFSEGPDPFNVSQFTPDNIDGAWTYGGETELALEGKPGRISAWYAYERFVNDYSELYQVGGQNPHTQRRYQSIRSFEPAQNKVGLTGRLNLPDHWTFNVHYRYATASQGDSLAQGEDAHSGHRLDLALAKEFAEGRGEFAFGVTDLLENTHDPILAFGQLGANHFPGTTFFGRVQFKF